MSKSTWGTATGMVGLLMTVAACSAEGPYSDDMEGPSAAASQAIMADSGTIDPPERSGPISPAPSNLRLASASSMTIKLDFACGRNATSHEVYRRVNGGAWAATPFWQAPCTDSLGIAWDRAVQPETSYCYKVKAYNLTNTAYSNVFCTVSPKDTVAPVAPVVDSVTDVTRTTLTVNYTDKANNETGFTVERSRYAAGIVLLGRVT